MHTMHLLEVLCPRFASIPYLYIYLFICGHYISANEPVHPKRKADQKRTQQAKEKSEM